MVSKRVEYAATFYDYDIHGNVEKLVQSLPELDPKTVEYDYDLLSGNVHRVTYQKGETDQFMHRYRYDADNRLEAVFTSADGYIWDEDARYLYYAHGPMARVELGEYKVQGIDYFYTLQGWIKGVNLRADHDAESGNVTQQYVSKDAFSYALHYYQNDYRSISGGFAWSNTNATDLFNGNIASMKTGLKTGGQQTMLYRYDQLNRIKSAVSSQNTYQTGYSYDANGNILSLLRNDQNNNTIDNLSYGYNTNANNRLNSVNDGSGNNTGLESGIHTYTYDEIGNLTSDREIESIGWTVYGKVESVLKRDGTTISYKYDGTGQRIYKKVVSLGVSKETHYVRDGSGNVLAIYENKVIDELVIYGSSRLGVYNGSTSKGKRTLGNKKYELSNHLGNVLSVISDNKIGIDSDTDLVADYYEPLVISESDYYPFGMAMKGRSFSNEEYRFGFNTQEKSTEIGEDTYTAEFWQYDSKIARRWNVDPVNKPWESSYLTFSGNPIYYVDVLGDNAGDYYSYDGKFLETDGKEDGKIYIYKDKSKDKKKMVTTDVKTVTQLTAVAHGESFNQANWDQRTAISATVVNRAKAAKKSVYDIITKYDYYRGINEQKAKDVLEKLKDFKGGSDMREKLSGKEVSSFIAAVSALRGADPTYGATEFDGYEDLVKDMKTVADTKKEDLKKGKGYDRPLLGIDLSNVRDKNTGKKDVHFKLESVENKHTDTPKYTYEATSVYWDTGAEGTRGTVFYKTTKESGSAY